MAPQLERAGSTEEEEVVEVDPEGRWVRYPEKLGHGSFKVAFKGFDKQLGIEIAWLKVTTNVHLSEEDKVRMQREVQILKSINNPHIIKCYGAWRGQNAEMNFITEVFTSGTLRDFRRKHKGITARHAVARWGKSILQGLKFLHEHTPPIIHRDLKCDNVFINGHSGEVKIADLGLAQVQNKAQTVIGTPEFMAPELYDEDYDERVDIYAFGMVMLELATLRFPYDEMRNAAQIFKAVSSGRMPDALADVTDEEVLEIIRACINHDRTKRPTASQLLEIPFFKDETDAVDRALLEEKQAEENSITVKVLEPEGAAARDNGASVVHLQLKIPKGEEGGKRQVVEFDYDEERDTIADIAQEMSEALNLSSHDQQEVMAKIEYQLDVRPGDPTIGALGRGVVSLTTPAGEHASDVGRWFDGACLHPDELREIALRGTGGRGRGRGQINKETKSGKQRSIRRSKSHATLVRIPVPAESAGVTVTQKENTACYRINVCTQNRKNLLFDLTSALRQLPLRVTNATIRTSDDGLASDAFDVELEPGCTLTSLDMEEFLQKQLKL